MRGSVVKRTDAKGKPRYFVVIDRTGPDGRRKRKWHSDPDTGSGFTAKSAAEKYAARLVVAAATGTLVDRSTVTVGEWADRWLASRKASLKPSTWSSYERNLRVHVRPVLGDVQLQRLTAADLDDLFAGLAVGGKKLKGKDPQPLSQRTLNYLATIVKAMLDSAVKRGMLVRNPAEQMVVPAVERDDESSVEIDWWTAAELGRFLDHIGPHRYGPILTVLALTGARRGEALALTWRDVDLPGRRLSIQRTTGRVGGVGLVTTSAKTRAGRRAVALDGDTAAALEEQRRRQDEEKQLVGAGYRDEGLVFANPDGSQINPDAISRTFDRESKAAGLRRIRLHDLRHTWASLALQSGVHPKVVQERLGHGHVSTTLSIYSHVAPVMHAEAAATVTALVRAAKAPNVTPLRASR